MVRIDESEGVARTEKMSARVYCDGENIYLGNTDGAPKDAVVGAAEVVTDPHDIRFHIKMGDIAVAERRIDGELVPWQVKIQAEDRQYTQIVDVDELAELAATSS
jgi:hypothetical protein